MPQLKLHYMITNGGDGSASASFYADEKTTQLACDLEDESEPFCENYPKEQRLEFDAKGVLLNPDKTKAELQRELAELRGEDAEEEDGDENDSVSGTFKKAAATEDDNCIHTGKIWFVVRNGGDGSASVDFYADAECADLASQIEEEGGEAFGDNPHSRTVTFSKGVLLNPDSTADELKKELAERRGEDDEQDEDASPASASFSQAAPAAQAKEEAFDLAGKTVVFTGKLSTMTRKQAESAATVAGAHVTDSVTKNTDILVVGEDAGSKLAKAGKLGVKVMTEAQWNQKMGGTAPVKKPPAPGR